MTEEMIISYLELTLEGWKELQYYKVQCQTQIPLFTNLVEDNARLRGKVSFYETHIRAMTIVSGS